MTSPPPNIPPAGRPGYEREGLDPARDHDAGRRAREVYSIFHPPSLIPPIDEDATWPPLESEILPHGALPTRHPSAAASPHLDAVDPGHTAPLVLEPHLGHHNETLTSFAQLAALRLDVERVLISVSDQDSQFIIAQAAQTSQGDLDLQHLSEGVWNGNTRLSLDDWIMCRDTLDLPPSDAKNGNYSFIEVNDLSTDERYRDLPFVRGDPCFRFYAGTPLTGEKEINIGSIFVLDKKPHAEGLTAVEKKALVTVGALVTEYLAVSRQATDGRRAARLSRALNYFVEGSSAMQERSSAPTTPAACTGSLSWSTPPPAPSSIRSEGQRSAEFPPRGGISETRSNQSQSTRSQGKRASRTRSSRTRSTSRERRESVASRSEGTTSTAQHRSSGSSTGSLWMFQRAANLLRESLELGDDGGVIFLRADPHLLHETKWRTSSSSGSEKTPRDTNLPHVLAASTLREPFASQSGGSRSTQYPASELNLEFLHQLLERYNYGRLWSFFRDGLLSSSDDDRPAQAESHAATADQSKGMKASENSTLNRYFPGATQVLFVPLWNAADSQWFAGCFCWNTLETRVFNPTVELSSVLGFASSIMAEYSRMQSVAADRQKSHFIGSISHELRSPLHGIMAAGEFLHGTRLDEFQRSLLDTISNCGRTLLDTMNQVLDYSKTVSSERGRAHAKRRSAKRTNSGASSLLDTSVATDLSALAEEVVEGVYLGHAYGQRSMAPSDCPEMATPQSLPDSSASNPNPDRPAVEVILDIARHHWVYQTHPGALRRIIMNLVGNALKYTEAGQVSLAMEVVEVAPRKAGANGYKPGETLMLTVSDTGKGISEEFLRNRLYTPFAQEDPLAVGTGLGLSIVRSLVKSLEGNITFHSSAGQGTTVKVSIPLTRPGLEDSSLERQFQDLTVQGTKGSEPIGKHAGRRVSILLDGEADQLSSSPRWSIIRRYLVEWFGIELVPPCGDSPADFMLVDGTTTVTLGSEDIPLPPIIVVWDPSISPSSPLPEWLSSAPTVNFVRLPCGPWKLSAAIERCLNQQSETSVAPPQVRALPAVQGDLPLEATTQTQSTLCPQCQNESPQESTVQRSTRGPRVLVVEDNPINRNLILTFLKKRNLAALESADNGKRAVEAVERAQQGYDLIFMDISMPVMNGFEATRAIRALERERDSGVKAKIIALTGLSSAEDEREALNAGMDMFVTKPFSFEKLSEYLDKWKQNEL